MQRLFPRYPDALARTMEIADRCQFSLEELTYQYPEEAIVPGKDAQSSLEHYVWECAPNVELCSIDEVLLGGCHDKVGERRKPFCSKFVDLPEK
ncbi:hypothetical protein CUJ84_pRLN3000089 (plasmid) [Rhizobium leguminosarum]|uniref:Uncharacterized protein n=1 Tax=Rhizobium leguminosarum TaxID=384 RepID=A0A2K9ZG45_RHILE|nr:hypothetical protein CUJ84_pRLN3000089 [Rhizobium leguminosarum]